jgi:hypothetical protein
MRAVKALMIGRLSLTWLWPVLLLVGLPNAQARVARADVSLPALISGRVVSENRVSPDFGLHLRSTRSVRSARRFDLETGSNDTGPASWSFQAPSIFGIGAACSCLEPDACLRLASGWQFLLRTAATPRAPSFVS